MFDAQDWAARRMAEAPRPQTVAEYPEEPCADAGDMKAALREARTWPWLWRLPDSERRRFETIYARTADPAIRATYANALLLDEEARRASGRR